MTISDITMKFTYGNLHTHITRYCGTYAALDVARGYIRVRYFVIQK